MHSQVALILFFLLTEILVSFLMYIAHAIITCTLPAFLLPSRVTAIAPFFISMTIVEICNQGAFVFVNCDSINVMMTAPYPPAFFPAELRYYLLDLVCSHVGPL